MARIRTIKPELPQSESLGRVSREARLCFILLFTLADDEGRLRGNPRMLAGILYPYDIDAPHLIEGWLKELENQSCIVRYQAGWKSYIEISRWLEHQKIDHPSKSKLPRCEESSTAGKEESSKEEIRNISTREGKGDSRSLASPREFSLTEAATAYCHTFSVVGQKNVELIREALELELSQCDSSTPQRLTEAFIEIRQNYEAMAGKQFEYPPVSFITSGIWKHPRKWMGVSNGRFHNKTKSTTVDFSGVSDHVPSHGR